MLDKDYIIATDGACKGNPGKGTWAFAVFDSKTKELLGHKKGHKEVTTNNEQELTAILEALKWADKFGKKVHFLIDSKYCVDGINNRMNGWARNGWRTKAYTPVKNLNLWKGIYTIGTAQHTFEWVKGHSGNRFNEVADTFCNEEYLNKFM